MLKGKSLLYYTNFVSPNDYENKNKIILQFSITKKVKKSYCVICGNYRKFGKPKISYMKV